LSATALKSTTGDFQAKPTKFWILLPSS